jgi:quercetin dioxygenase-like cupin family protein
MTRYRAAGATQPSVFGPYQVRSVITGDDSGGAMSIIEYTASDGAGAEDPHAQSREDVSVVMLDGAATFEADGEPHALGAGDSLSIAKGSFMRRLSVDQAPARYLMIFTPGGFDQFFVEGAEMIGRRMGEGASLEDIMPEVHAMQDRYGVIRG